MSGFVSQSGTEALSLYFAPATQVRARRPGYNDVRKAGVASCISCLSAKYGPMEINSLPVSDVMAVQWRLGAGFRIGMPVAGPGGRAAVSCPGAWWSDEGIVGKFSRRFVYKCVFTQCALFSARPPPSARRRGPTWARALTSAAHAGLRPGRSQGRLRSGARAEAEFINNPRPPLWGRGAFLAEDGSIPPPPPLHAAPRLFPLGGS